MSSSCHDHDSDAVIPGRYTKGKYFAVEEGGFAGLSVGDHGVSVLEAPLRWIPIKSIQVS